MNRKADAKDVEEYNALYRSIDERERPGAGLAGLLEWQNEEEALYRPSDRLYHADDHDSVSPGPG